MDKQEVKDEHKQHRARRAEVKSAQRRKASRWRPSA